MKIKPNDPRPPLSKIKIPLGAGYMIHEATKADDIGRAVSHGCILMLRADLLDLAEKIVTARNLPVTKSRIAQLRDSHERLAASLDPPLLVDINYDLQVVEGGALHVYPDVYERGAFALDSLRAELQSAGVASPLLEDQALRRILDHVSVDTQFVINVADIRKGRWGADVSCHWLTSRLRTEEKSLWRAAMGAGLLVDLGLLRSCLMKRNELFPPGRMMRRVLMMIWMSCLASLLLTQAALADSGKRERRRAWA